MANIKVLSFIILALAVSCSRKEKLEKALDSINPLLSPYTEFDGSDASVEVSSFMNKVLEISPNRDSNAWLSFLSGLEAEDEDIVARGDSDLTEDKLREAALKSAQEAYPALDSEKFQENNHKWHQADKGYLTFLPYVLNGYSNLVRRFYIKQLFKFGHNQNNENGELGGLAVQNDADAAFSGALVSSIKQYAQYYTARQIFESEGVEEKDLHQKCIDLVKFTNTADPAKRYNIGTKDDAKRIENANKLVAASNEASHNAHEVIQRSLHNNHERIYQAYHQIRNFQTSIPYYFKEVIDYLTLYAEEAPAEQIEVIAARIKDLTRLLYKVSQNGKDELTVDQYIETFLYNAQKTCVKKDEESANFRKVVAPQIYQAWLEVVAEIKGTEASLLIVRKLIRLCLPQPLSALGADYVYKRDLVDYPLTGANHNQVEDALIAWDFLYEVPEKGDNSQAVEWWTQASKNVHKLFNVDAKSTAVLLWVKRLFNYRPPKNNENNKIMKALYKLVLKFAQSDLSDVTKENSPEKVLAFLEAHSTDSEFSAEFADLKSHISRSIPKKQLV